jgi:SAM-dependent methyltransferase
MHDAWVPLLRCPVTGDPLELDVVRREGDDLLEGFLVGTRAREVRPLLAGVAVLPEDLRAHLRAQGAVYWRTPLAEPRLARLVLGRAGRGFDLVPIAEVVARYGDLAGVAPAAPEDVALGALLSAHAPARGLGLDVGAGVGRGTFVLAGRLGRALGVDRSVARVRRARNLSVTREHFFLPADPEGRVREAPVDLSGLPREGADFAVADPGALPLEDRAFDVVVLRAADGRGAWPDPARAVAEAARVTRPGGLLLLADGLPRPGGAGLARGGPFEAFRTPEAA